MAPRALTAIRKRNHTFGACPQSAERRIETKGQRIKSGGEVLVKAGLAIKKLQFLHILYFPNYRYVL